MKISREQFKMFQRTCKRFNIPKDSIHLNLKTFEKTCRHMFKRRYILTTRVHRYRNRSVLVRWIKRSGFFAPHQKQTPRWRRMRWDRSWTEVVRAKFQATPTVETKKKGRTSNGFLRFRMRLMMKKFKKSCERKAKLASQRIVASAPVSPPKPADKPSQGQKKVDDDWWGGKSKKTPVKKPFETLCLLSSDEEEDTEKPPQQPILANDDIKKEGEDLNMMVAEDLIEEDVAEVSVVQAPPKPVNPTMTTVKVIRLIKPPALSGTKFTFIDSLISKLSNNTSATLPTITLKKSIPQPHCSKIVAPLPAAPPKEAPVPQASAPAPTVIPAIVQPEILEWRDMSVIPKRGQKRKVSAEEQPATASPQKLPDLQEPNSSDTELFFGFHANEINEKTNSPPKYKNINHSAFLGSDTNLDDLNLNENELLEPMREQRLNYGMVDDKAKAPKLQMPKRPDNMKKARTVAEKKIMLQNKHDIRIKMIESESKIFHELNKRNRMSAVMGGEASTASWARSAEFKNYELMEHLQNQDVPFTRDSWRALAFLKTEDRKYYFQNLRIDGLYVKLTGSRGNLNSQVLGGRITSWPGLRLRSISRKEVGRCCRPIELPKDLLIHMIVNDEIVSFGYDATRRRKQDVKTYKLDADQLERFNSASWSPTKSLLDSDRPKRPGPLSSKLRQRQHSDDETDLLPVQTMQVFKMPTLQLEVFPKIDVPLDRKVRPYLKFLLPFEKITPEWASFAVSTLKPTPPNRRDPKAVSAASDRIVSYTFNMPYANDETQILVRKCRTRRNKREWAIGQPHMLDEKLNLEEPLTFTANVDLSDEVEVAIAEMLTDMTDSVAISCNEDAFTHNDPDLVYDQKEAAETVKKVSEGVVVGGTDKDLQDVDAKNKKISKRVITELRRLNATFITAANKDKDEEKDKVCTHDFCLKGCMCETLNQYIPALRQKHCSKAACMFKCLCGYIEEHNELSSLTHDDVRSLRDKATARLAPVEKEFTPTIVLTNNRPILIAGKEHESRRSKKVPKRYDDFMVTKEDVPVQSTKEVGPAYRAKATLTKASELIEVTSAPRRPKPVDPYSGRVEQMLHVNVSLNRLQNLKEIEPFCMVHSLFKCFCRLEKTQGILFSFHNPQSIAEAVKVSAERGKAPEERPHPKTIVTNAELLRHTKRAAEIDHGMYNTNPAKQARTKPSSSAVSANPQRQSVAPVIERLLDDMDNDSATLESQRCLPISRVYEHRNFFQKENIRKNFSDFEKQNPELLERLRRIVDKCFEDYKDEVHRQRLGFPKLEIECRMTEPGDKKDPIMIYVKDSEEKILTNPILKNLADGSKLLIFTGAKKYYIKKQDYEKNGKYLIDSLRKQTENPIYVIQRDPVTMAAGMVTRCQDLLETSTAALDSLANKTAAPMTSVQKLNAMTTVTMQNICDMQRENSKQLMEPRDGQIYVYGWEHVLKGFEQNYIFVWEVTFNDDTRSVLITTKNVRPKLVNMASVVNVKYLTLATEDVSLVSRLLMLRVDTDQTRNMALLLKGTMSLWIVCGFLKSKESYVTQGLKVRPTPHTHPQLSKKISTFYEQTFGPKKATPPLSRPSTKGGVEMNNIVAGKQTKDVEPVIPVISHVSSLHHLVAKATKPPVVETKAPENSPPVVCAPLPPVIVVEPPVLAVAKPPVDLESSIPISSIDKSAAPQLTTAPPAPVETMEQKLNAVKSNIGMFQHNIQNTLALPIQKFAHRWFMLTVVNDFSDIYIPQWKSFLAYDKILRAIVMAQRVNKTVQLQSSSKFPQVFAVPETVNRIFFGPYDMKSGVDFKLCQNIDGEMMLREEYESRFGVKRVNQRTTGCWLYLKSITARNVGRLPVAPGTTSAREPAVPASRDKRKSEGQPPVPAPVKKSTGNISLLKNPAQRQQTATATKPSVIPASSKTTPQSVEVPTILINPKSVASSATPAPTLITSSCIINNVLVAPTPVLPNPVGHLANQPIFPKFNIQFTTGNQVLNNSPATVTAGQRSEAKTQENLDVVPGESSTGEPVFVIVNFPPVPATTDQRRSGTPIANIDLTDDDGRKAASEEIDLTSDDEQGGVTQIVQVSNPLPVRRKSTYSARTPPPLVPVTPHNQANCVATNCSVCSSIKVTKIVPSSTSDKLCDEIRKRLSTPIAVKAPEPVVVSNSMLVPASLPTVKRNSLPSLATKPLSVEPSHPKQPIVPQLVPTQPNIVHIRAIRHKQEPALKQTKPYVVKTLPTPSQHPVIPTVTTNKPKPRPASPKAMVIRKLPTLKTAMAPKPIAEPQLQPTVTAVVPKPTVVVEPPTTAVIDEVAKDADEATSSSERVQFGYFVSSFIFLGRFKAKETTDTKKFTVKFPSADTFEWKHCETSNETGEMINKFLVDKVYATIPHAMPITWKFITNRNVFNSYQDFTDENLNKNMIISKYGIQNLMTADFDKLQLRDIKFYHEVLSLKLAKVFMEHQDYISLAEMYKNQDDAFAKTQDIVSKATQFIAELKLKEQKLQQLKKTCLAINKRLRSAVSGPKLDPVVDLDADDSSSSDSRPVTVVEHNDQKKIIDKIRNVKIISKLPKDLTVKSTTAEKAQQQLVRISMQKRKSVSQYGPAPKRVGSTTIRTVPTLTIDSADSSSGNEYDSDSNEVPVGGLMEKA